MATVVNKTTLQVIKSVNTPEYDPSEWLINPDIPDAPKRHWKVSGDNLTLKTASQIASADAEWLSQVKSDKKDEFKEELGEAWIDEGQELLYAAQDNVDAATTEDEVSAMELNLDAWLAADPQVVIRTAKGIE